MSRLTVKVPDVGEGVAEVEIVSWAVSEGQEVERDQIIAEVMTDKATVEVPAPVDGVVRAMVGAVGDILLVGSPLFALDVAAHHAATDDEIDAEMEAVLHVGVDHSHDDPTGPGPQAPPSPGARPKPAPKARPKPAPKARPVLAPGARPVLAPAADATAAGPTSSKTPATARAGRAGGTGSPTGPRSGAGGAGAFSGGAPRAEGRAPTATPAVRRRAREAGIDLRTITGTGPAGRITHDDLDAAFSATNGSGRAGTASAQIERAAANDTVTDQPIVGIRRKIAEQMVASTTTIPHITYVEEIDMTALEELRRSLNEQSDQGATPRQKLTILPFLIRALVRELPDFPTLNAHVLDPGGDGPATLRTFGGVHVGIATQTDSGLVVPVVHHAEASSLWAIAEQIADLADAARSGTAERTDLTGSTITITSLGPLGGLMSTPVINRPETTIIGVNKMMTKPVWIDGSFVPRTMMNLSSSFDHRVIDGWVAASFVQALKRSLEQPALLFVESP